MKNFDDDQLKVASKAVDDLLITRGLVDPLSKSLASAMLTKSDDEKPLSKFFIDLQDVMLGFTAAKRSDTRAKFKRNFVENVDYI